MTTTVWCLVLHSICVLSGANQAPADFDKIISSVHARSEANRAAGVRQWVLDPSASINDVQGSMLPATIAVLFCNCNATAVSQANTFLETAFANRSTTWWKSTFGNSPVQRSPLGPTVNYTFSGAPLESAKLVRAFSMFHSKSRFVAAGSVAKLSSKAEAGLSEFFFQYLVAATMYFPQENQGSVWTQYQSENIDTVRQTTCFLAATTLANDASYATRALPDGTLVHAAARQWEAFVSEWLKERALNGLFVELASTGYWARTWPCLFNLHDLPPPTSQVHRRAKMMIDIAMVEAELASIAGVRTGQKSRAKKGGFGHHEGLGHNMYSSVTPWLYGNTASSFAPMQRVVAQEAGFYQMSNVSVLIHMLGVGPDTHGVHMVRNRMIGQVASTDVASCSAARCKETLRPYPCSCVQDTDAASPVPHITYLNASQGGSKQVHVISHTPAYSLGGVVFSPNDAFSANTQQRWTGLVFANAVHTTVGLPHLTGEKWALIDQEVMIAQRCGSCNYGGNVLFEIYNASNVWQNVTSGWTFVAAHDVVSGHPLGWAALRPAWGNSTYANATGSGACAADVHCGQLVPHDTWAPLLLVVGSADKYKSADNFSDVVAMASLHGVSLDIAGPAPVRFVWDGNAYAFTPGPSAWNGTWTLPTTNGSAVDIDPVHVYDSVHLKAELGSNVVTATYTSVYSIAYNFTDDSIRRL